MEPIATSEEMGEEGDETIEICDTEKEIEQSLVGTLGDKCIAMKKVIFENQLLQHCSSQKLHRTRAYQVWPGKNIFFFHGRLICGPDLKGLMLTVTSLVLSSWIFARYVGKDFPPHSALIVAFSCILAFIVLVNLFMVSAIDPGIIPRNIDQESSVKVVDGDNMIRRSKKVIINGIEMKLKYCRICNIFRPLRSCHCAICDNCVERFDHHSPWIGQCVAKRNHQFYIVFLLFALIFYVYIFAFSCMRLHQRMLKNSEGFSEMVKKCPETLVLAAFSLTASGFLGGITIYHVYLTAINETAYENFRGRYVGTKNPYDRGIISNIKEALFVGVAASRIDFRGEVKEEGPQMEGILAVSE